MNDIEDETTFPLEDAIESLLSINIVSWNTNNILTQANYGYEDAIKVMYIFVPGFYITLFPDGHYTIRVDCEGE